MARIVRLSTTTKARLLHYFPSQARRPMPSNNSEEIPSQEDIEDDDWCATHIDHGCLTGLTSALYIDELAHPPTLPPDLESRSPPQIPALAAPSPSTGLYIKSRTSAITKVNIPSSCLGFQTGEALELITDGKFRAVPHFVRTGGSTSQEARIARNTLAVFTQPDLGEIVDRKRGLTFADFSKEVIGRFG